MEIGKFTLTFAFWLPWLFGYGKGWGSKWFDFGAFCIYWPDNPLSSKEELAIALYGAVAHRFGSRAAYSIDTIFFMLTGVSGYLLVVKQKG